MFVGMAGAYPRVEKLKCTLLGYAPGLSYKHRTRLERPVSGKHTGLLQKFVERFITLGP